MTTGQPRLLIDAEVLLGGATLAPKTRIAAHDGDIIGVVGPSGGGKSTMLMAAVGWLPPGAELRGTIDVDGRSPFSLTTSELAELRRHTIAFVGQDPGAELNPFFSIAGLLTELAPDGDVDDVLTSVGLSPSLRRRRIGQLSGGQQRRVALARAILREPSVVVLDEPLAGLDPQTAEGIIELLRSLADRGTAVVFTGHNLREVEDLADSVVTVGDATEGVAHASPGGDTATAHPHDAILSCSQLTLVSPDGTLLSDNAHVSLGRGEVLGIIGPSGCGKSTLFRAILGRSTHSTGTVTVCGNSRDVQRPIPRKLRGAAQLVPQDPASALNPRMSAVAAVTRAARHYPGLSRAQQRERAEQLLRDLGIDDDHMWYLPQRLSGGQRQRVSLARALAPGAPLILCDEVTSALDAASADRVMSYIAATAATGTAVIAVSHDEERLRRWCHRVVHFTELSASGGQRG